MRIRIATVLVMSALLAVPTIAAAGPTFNLGTGKLPDGLVDPATGTLHAVWGDDPETTTIRYCQVPRGATACALTRDVTVPDFKAADPKLARDPTTGTLYITLWRYVPGDAYLFSSTDGGTTWSGAQKIAATGGGTGAGEPTVGPVAGEVTMSTLNPGKFVMGSKIDGSEAASTTRADLPGGGVFDFSIAPTGDGGLVAIGDDGDLFFWRLPPGEDPSDVSKWTAPSSIGPGRSARIAGGPTGAYVLSELPVQGGTPDARIQRWTGSGFGAPVSFGAGENGRYMYDLTVAPAGQVAAVWRTNASPNRLRIIRSLDNGATFSAPATFAGTTSLAADLDVAIANDGGGFGVFKDDAKTIQAASLDPIPEPTPTPQPTPTPAPTPTPTAAKPKQTVVSVPGAKITFETPSGCVAPGTTYRVKLKWRRQRRKGNLFIKIIRTDFYIGSKIVKKDRKAPFVAILRVTVGTQSGSKVTVRARGFIKSHDRKRRTKSIRATVRVC